MGLGPRHIENNIKTRRLAHNGMWLPQDLYENRHNNSESLPTKGYGASKSMVTQHVKQTRDEIVTI